LKNKILIIGGNSRLGKELSKLLRISKINHVTTTRRKKTKNYFELKKPTNFNFDQGFTACVILAGVTNYKKCEKNKSLTRLINCDGVIALSKQILNRKIFLCYISTNTVFNSKFKSKESSTPKPNFEYARQKYYVEKKLTGYAKKNNKKNYLSIIRLTKNLSNDTEPFRIWFKKIERNKKIKAFNDLYFSPILFENSAKIISKILVKKYPGIFHISNISNLSYFNFAKKLFSFLKIDRNKIIKTSSKKEKINLIYSNKQTSLSMVCTNRKLKTKYITLDEIFKYIKKKINEKN